MEPFHSLPEFVTLEHQVQTILTQQEQHGWHFDTDAARQFALALTSELREIEETLRRRHPFVDGGEWTPKRNNSRQGYVEGASLCRLKETNPSSRDHQAWILQQFYGWKPTQLTSYWQMCHRRDSSEGYQLRDEPCIPPDFDDNEDAWNDIARRERVSQACYEC